MSNNIIWSRQCSCSAFFPTVDGLNGHLEEYRSRERHLLSQKVHLDTELEICRTHLRADDDVGQDTDEDNEGRKSGDGKSHYCPFQTCDRVQPFKSRQALRVHYQQHVDCNEICVCCHIPIETVRKYIRHTKQHQSASETKATYMNRMRDELSDLADEQLELAETRKAERSRKRAREGDHVDSHPRGVRPRLDEVDTAIMEPSHPQHPSSINAPQEPSFVGQPYLSSATISTPAPNANNSAAVGSLENMSEGLNLDQYDAYVHHLINFPESWRILSQ